MKMKLRRLFGKKQPPSEGQKAGKLEENEVLTFIKVLKDRSIVAEQLRVSPREEAAMKLGEAHDKRAIQPLLDAVASESESDMLRYLALEALGKIGGEEVREGIISAFKSGSHGLREMILSKLDPEKGVLSKTGLSRTVFYGESEEKMSVIDKAEQYYKEGNTYWNKREWEKALAKFKEASNLNSNHPFVHGTLGQVYIELGNIQEAEREFHKQTEVNDDEFYSHAILSIIFRAKGMSLEALEEETRAMHTSQHRESPVRITRDYADKIEGLVKKYRK
jgi:tetratricopeptide (TPR) repeat protein